MARILQRRVAFIRSCFPFGWNDLKKLHFLKFDQCLNLQIQDLSFFADMASIRMLTLNNDVLIENLNLSSDIIDLTE